MRGRFFLGVTAAALLGSALVFPRAAAQAGAQQGVVAVSRAIPARSPARVRLSAPGAASATSSPTNFANPISVSPTRTRSRCPKAAAASRRSPSIRRDTCSRFSATPPGKPQLFEFDQNHKLVRTIGDEVIGHQNKAHGMAIDADDNIWICDENGDTVMKLSPEGKLLMTIGVRGQRGDWDEAKGQRLLWQPLHLAFAPNGDIYIGEGHANESPNDTEKSPANSIGAARVLHLDKNGKFINQWFGNHAGQGHFSMVHGIAINPDNGNVLHRRPRRISPRRLRRARQVHQDDSAAEPHLRPLCRSAQAAVAGDRSGWPDLQDRLGRQHPRRDRQRTGQPARASSPSPATW